MRIIFLGDIVGRPGRQAVVDYLPKLRKKYQPDMVIANGENAAGGRGITKEIADDLYKSGVDVLTMGNHVWDRKEIFDFIDCDQRLIRPANYPPESPGSGYTIIDLNKYKVGVINVSGRVFLDPLDCPFRTVDNILTTVHKETCIVIVDFHAEATSEKVAFGWYFDGRVTAVLGTHTHVQTSDERVLPKGTAYITDVGMTGPRDSVLGVKIDSVLKKFLTQMPVRFEVASGPVQINGVLLDVDEQKGKAVAIERIRLFFN